MFKKIGLLVGAAALIVGVPAAAIALTNDGGDSLNTVVPVIAQVQNQTATTSVGSTDATTPVLTQQRLRIHAETGPPEGFEPIQRRLHQTSGVSQGGPGMAGQGYRGGNPDAPHPGTGTCTNPDGPIGSGPHGPAVESN